MPRAGEAGSDRGAMKTRNARGRGKSRRAGTSSLSARERASLRPGEYIIRAHRRAGTALQAFRDIAKKAGPLDAQTCELILMACFAVQGHEEPFKNHALRALQAGISKEALQHVAILPLGAATVIPRVVQVLRWIDEAHDRYRAGKRAG
jgi:alkylhydroperoxidase/carboxymuconolactone decarboxylase family protein YurZ